MDISGSRALVTGGGTGIGRAIAARLRDEGAEVAVMGRRREPLEAAAAGFGAVALPGDVSVEADCVATVAACVERLGGLDVLVNNAGFGRFAPLVEMEKADFEAVMATNVTGAMLMAREAARHFVKQGSGNIVNISSTSGLHGNVGQANYSTAKAGIVGLTKCIAKEWGSFGIRCNAVAFGFISTRLTDSKEKGETLKVGEKEVALGIPEGMRERAHTGNPLGRPGVPEEGAGGILMMASPWGSYITGHCLEVTGGAGI